MSTDKIYDKVFANWKESQENVIEQIDLNIQNSRNMIEVHKKSLKILLKGSKLEKQLLEAAVKNKQ